jgi:hypothetical protein
MRLVQFHAGGAEGIRVARVGKGGQLHVLAGVASTYALAKQAADSGRRLGDLVAASPAAEAVDYRAVIGGGRLLPPLTHPDPAHLLVTGTGLTHLGSASARDAMHHKVAGDEESLSDSMKMFKWGIAGGKPADGGPGSQPEWFFKGDGQCVIAPDQPFRMPAFAEDGGEEPEIVGLYIVARDGTPCRVGFALGNEFSDHVMERRNYLYLAHSKLRQCAFGPELRLGPLPDTVQGMSRIRRGGQVIWEKPFVSGEGNMTHRIAGLEHHHFKYAAFRRPGDVHCHFFGTATLSVADGVRTEPGDEFEIASDDFGEPLRNKLERAAAESVEVREL